MVWSVNAELALWPMHGALLLALVCIVSRAPGDEGAALGKCRDAYDNCQPSPCSGDEVCWWQPGFCTILCWEQQQQQQQQRAYQFGNAAIVDGLLYVSLGFLIVVVKIFGPTHFRELFQFTPIPSQSREIHKGETQKLEPDFSYHALLKNSMFLTFDDCFLGERLLMIVDSALCINFNHCGRYAFIVFFFSLFNIILSFLWAP